MHITQIRQNLIRELEMVNSLRLEPDDPLPLHQRMLAYAAEVQNTLAYIDSVLRQSNGATPPEDSLITLNAMVAKVESMNWRSK